jgi:hypothetical protein
MTTIPASTSNHHALWRRLAARLRHLCADDSGMSTVEYAIGTIAAAAFAAIL